MLCQIAAPAHHQRIAARTVPMTKRRILLVSFLFPPNAGIGGLRVGKLAKFLTERGWDVRVLTCESGGAKDLPVEIPAEHIVRTAWFEVDHALDRFIPDWYRGNATAGANNGQASGAATTAIDVGVPLKSTLRRVYTEIVRWPDSRIGWMPHAMRQGRTLLDRWRPDFIYASAPPATCAVIADALSRRYRVPWIAEFRDLWTDNPYYDHSEKRRKLERVWERRVLGRAAGIVTVSHPWRAHLERKFGKPTALAMNGYVLEDFPATPPLPASTEGAVQIVYTGGIYEGYRDPTPLFQAIARLAPAEREQVRVDFVGASNETIRTLAQRCGVEDRVTVGPPIPYREALRMQMRADVLLHLQWNDPKEEGTISGKLFEYFAARRPVLGIGYDSGSVAQLLREHQAGAVCNAPDGIAGMLRDWIRQKQAGGIAPLSDIAVAGLSRNEQFEKVERFLLALKPTAMPAKAAALPARDMTGMSRTKHYRPIDTSAWSRPCLVALIDTEEDFDWRQPFSRENQSTASLANLNRAQEVFQRFGVVPTYLVDYPITKNPMGPELIGDWARQGHCVVGAQLHPGVNPPHAETVGVHNSYAGNLPA
jgi:glycosyltransferase involved in cell wall biosynthesis